jgi:hypothetical protein
LLSECTVYAFCVGIFEWLSSLLDTFTVSPIGEVFITSLCIGSLCRGGNLLCWLKGFYKGLHMTAFLITLSHYILPGFTHHHYCNNEYILLEWHHFRHRQALSKECKTANIFPWFHNRMIRVLAGRSTQPPTTRLCVLTHVYILTWQPKLQSILYACVLWSHGVLVLMHILCMV